MLQSKNLYACFLKTRQKRNQKKKELREGAKLRGRKSNKSILVHIIRNRFRSTHLSNVH